MEDTPVLVSSNSRIHRYAYLKNHCQTLTGTVSICRYIYTNKSILYVSNNCVCSLSEVQLMNGTIHSSCTSVTVEQYVSGSSRISSSHIQVDSLSSCSNPQVLRSVVMKTCSFRHVTAHAFREILDTGWAIEYIMSIKLWSLIF